MRLNFPTPKSDPKRILGAALALALIAVGAGAFLVARGTKAGPPVCDEACLKQKEEISKQLLSGTFPPPLSGTLPPGAPVQPYSPPPFDTCKATLTLGTNLPTLATLVGTHGKLGGCGADFYAVDNQGCDQHAGGNLPVCPAGIPQKVTIWLEAGGYPTDPGPGFLTCVQVAQQAASTCGIPITGKPDEDLRTDRSSNWVFTPFPAGTHVLPYPPQAGPAPADTTGDPIGGCVGNNQEKFLFRVVSHKFTPGCPPPWN